MVYVAVFELMAEAVEQCGGARTAVVAGLAFCLMTFSQEQLKGSIFEGGGTGAEEL